MRPVPATAMIDIYEDMRPIALMLVALQETSADAGRERTEQAGARGSKQSAYCSTASMPGPALAPWRARHTRAAARTWTG